MARDSKLWTVHLLAGCVILALLGVHMVTMHLDSVVSVRALNPAGGHPIDWANVVARGKTLLTPLAYVGLLGAALFHGFYGLRNILLELNPRPGLARAIGVVLTLVGIGLFAFGTWAAIASHTLAKTV